MHANGPGGVHHRENSRGLAGACRFVTVACRHRNHRAIDRAGGRHEESRQRFAAARFLLALDDTGTGNAGLELLSQLCVDFVKIDKINRSIIVEAMTDRSFRA